MVQTVVCRGKGTSLGKKDTLWLHGLLGDPFLITLKCLVSYVYGVYCLITKLFPQHQRPLVVLTIRTPNLFLQCLDTI